MLKTRNSRFLFLAIVVALIAAPAWVWFQNRPIPPDAWYGYTVPRDQVLAFSDGKPVQYMITMSPGSGWSRSDLQAAAARCDPGTIRGGIVGREYRGVMLCNAASLGEAEFAVARELLDHEVDSMFGRYHFEWAWLVGERLAILLAALVALCVSAMAFRWVRAGRNA